MWVFTRDDDMLCHIAEDDDHEGQTDGQAHGLNDAIEFVSGEEFDVKESLTSTDLSASCSVRLRSFMDYTARNRFQPRNCQNMEYLDMWNTILKRR